MSLLVVFLEFGAIFSDKQRQIIVNFAGISALLKEICLERSGVAVIGSCINYPKQQGGNVYRIEVMLPSFFHDIAEHLGARLRQLQHLL